MEKKLKRVLIINSKATIESVYAALILTNGALSEGIEAEMFFTFFGLEAIHKEKAKHLHVATVGNPAMHMPTVLGAIPGVEALATGMMMKGMEALDIPSVPEFLDMIKAAGGKLYGCKLAMQMFKLEASDMRDDLDGILTVGEFYERANVDGSQIIFV
jgi:peroxiredoxin family protein